MRRGTLYKRVYKQMFLFTDTSKKKKKKKTKTILEKF